MAAEDRSPESYRELRLEGFGLLLAATLLVGLVGAAFFLGRWTERRSQPQLASREAADPLAAVTPAEPVPERPDSYFDKVGGSQKQAEPRREVTRPAPRPEPPPEPRPEPPAPSSPPSTEPIPPVPQETAQVPPTATESDQGARPARAGDFQIQVFAGRDREAAEQVAAKLREQGYRVQSLVESEGASELFKVRVGAYSNADEARRVAQELSGRGYPGSWVIRVE
jgi:cell division protein FtsN